MKKKENVRKVLVDALKEAQSYILRQKKFNIRNSDDFHIACIMASAITTGEGRKKP
jgi:hypothetical protein